MHILLETFHSNTNIYELQFSDMPHIVAFPRWPPLTLKVGHGSKLKHAPISLKIVSNGLSCHKDSKNV